MKKQSTDLHLLDGETFRYIAPEQVPVQYGGLSRREGEQEFTSADTATEETIKPSSKHTVEFPVTEVTQDFLFLNQIQFSTFISESTTVYVQTCETDCDYEFFRGSLYGK